MRRIIFPSLVAAVVVIGLLHHFTPAHFAFSHNTFRRLGYFPIVLGGLWFGARGGLILAILSSIAFVPHVLLYLGKGPQAYLGELAEVVLYFAAGLLVGTISDRQARLRESYRQLSEKLQGSYTRLQEETGQLIQAEKQLTAARKFSELGAISASLAHEIKNPLGSIRGTAEILGDEFPENHPKREFVDILLKETGRLQAAVDRILHYPAGAPREEKEPLEPLAGVVGHVAALLGRQFEEKKVALVVVDQEKNRDFLVPGTAFSQVLLNLVLNAHEAVSPGGHIWLSMERTGKGGVFSVCDDGPGVADAQKELIFEPFYSGKPDGTGLGLLISAKIVASCGGTLSVRDRKGGGACFDIFLPEQTVSSPWAGNGGGEEMP